MYLKSVYADKRPVMNSICVRENCCVLGFPLVPGNGGFGLPERYYFPTDLFKVKHVTYSCYARFQWVSQKQDFGCRLKVVFDKLTPILRNIRY